jgi:hypothetical protein
VRGGLSLILLVLGLGTAFTLGCSSRVSLPVGSGAASTSDAGADGAFIDLDGKALRPFDDPAIKAVALVFVLPDCPIANTSLPEINRLHEEFGPQGVRFVVVHADPEIAVEKARKHAAEYQIRPAVALDPRHEWLKRAGATASPEAAVFARGGELLYRGRINDQYVGLGKRRAVVTSHDLRDALAAVVAGEPIANSRTEAVGCPLTHLP